MPAIKALGFGKGNPHADHMVVLRTKIFYDLFVAARYGEQSAELERNGRLVDEAAPASCMAGRVSEVLLQIRCEARDHFFDGRLSVASEMDDGRRVHTEVVDRVTHLGGLHLQTGETLGLFSADAGVKLLDVEASVQLNELRDAALSRLSKVPTR